VSGAKIESLTVSAYTVPTDAPESDGTLEWDLTTIVLVEAAASGERGLGYTYGDLSTGKLIESKLAGAVNGQDAMRVQSSWAAMQHALRNAGRPGIGAMAVAAVDTALWDLKARLLEIPLADLLGRFNEGVPVYGSGGFTSYSVERLREQLSRWVAQGIPRVKMKVGREPEQDLGRVIAAREAIGPDAELMVDANGAYDRKQALEKAQAFSRLGVAWYEEPVSSDDLEGLRLIRDRRVRLRCLPLPTAAGSGSGGRLAGGRHALCGDHGSPEGRRPVQGAQRAALGALCAPDPRPRLLRRGDARPLRVLP
jgi:L-alanine-DL-glutamate epimerase-like enolase superfamily enzyme